MKFQPKGALIVLTLHAKMNIKTHSFPGLDTNQLDNIPKGDHATEHRVSEQMLIKTLETLYNSTNGDLDNCEARILALIMSIATIIKVDSCHNNHLIKSELFIGGIWYETKLKLVGKIT